MLLTPALNPQESALNAANGVLATDPPLSGGRVGSIAPPRGVVSSRVVSSSRAQLIEITIRDPLDAEPKRYLKALACDDELWDLVDRAAAKYGAPGDPDLERRWPEIRARAQERARQWLAQR